MIRVRTSTLEAFRRVVDTPYGDETALVRAISGNPDPPNWMMQAGTAWHHVLQYPLGTQHFSCADGTPREIHRGPFNYHFAGADVDNALRHVGPGLCEVTGRLVLDIWDVPVEVQGTADHIRGLVIQDHKTKFSTPDPKDYENSLQWRFYLLIHQAAVFRYNLFHFKDPTEEGFCELKDIVSCKFWRYPALEYDCRVWLSRFLDWAHSRKLAPYLDTQQEAA